MCLTNRLNFSTNWNRKLDCNRFSTIRRYRPQVHYVGRTVEIYDTQAKQIKGKGVYVVCEPFQLHQLKEAAAMLDTGYSLEETKQIIRTMYKHKCDNVDQETFAYIIIKKVKEKVTQQNLEL